MEKSKRVIRQYIIYWIVPVCLVAIHSQIVSGQTLSYVYVLDDDLFVNVRENSNVQSSIIDRLYNLQIIKTDHVLPSNDFKKVYDFNDTEIGYVHQSRLVDIPDNRREIELDQLIYD